MRIKRIAIWALAHAALSALLWIWSLGVAMGLGFKDRALWTVWDQVQSAVVPALAFTLTLPGRLCFDLDLGWAGFLLAWASNSLLWATVLTSVHSMVRRRRHARQAVDRHASLVGERSSSP
ncbi:hypothetical protein [Roseateles violae]|uniref:Uncharacterized protein n=1 Tax=Roseateles violae TaxID=3058042 RepID=A0ABT8DM04_9BURK|nr:hypothetical protein [Pelomonas sp. PFR6]MDN3919437.1 hypothetical protein [Pelomonas sp. PFR6]